jgi:hypothetical protein
MTYGDVLRAMSDEELAGILTAERMQIAKVIFEQIGVGVTEEYVFFKYLKMLRQEVK